MLHPLYLESPPKRDPDGHCFGLVSCCDILGFSAHAWTRSAAETKQILDFGLNYQRSAGNTIGSHGTPPRECIRFQDTMVRCTEIGWAYDDELKDPKHFGKWYVAILEEVASLRDILINFVGERILLRGALAIGSYDVIGGVVVGPAYERAMRMEATEARFPRVILAKEVSGFLDFIPAYRRLWFDVNLRQDETGLTYIDYLRGCAFEAPWDLSWFGKSLESHKYALDALCASAPTEEEAQAKLEWLVNYHNLSVSELAGTAPRAWELDWPTFRCRGF